MTPPRGKRLVQRTDGFDAIRRLRRGSLPARRTDRRFARTLGLRSAGCVTNLPAKSPCFRHQPTHDYLLFSRTTEVKRAFVEKRTGRSSYR